MLDKNEGHSGIDGKVLQESCKRLQPSGGSAYPNDGERGQRLKIILFDVPCSGTAVILCIRCGPGMISWLFMICFIRSIRACITEFFDYASLGRAESIEACTALLFRRGSGEHPCKRKTSNKYWRFMVRSQGEFDYGHPHGFYARWTWAFFVSFVSEDR